MANEVIDWKVDVMYTEDDVMKSFHFIGTKEEAQLAVKAFTLDATKAALEECCGGVESVFRTGDDGLSSCIQQYDCHIEIKCAPLSEMGPLVVSDWAKALARKTDLDYMEEEAVKELLATPQWEVAFINGHSLKYSVIQIAADTKEKAWDAVLDHLNIRNFDNTLVHVSEVICKEEEDIKRA